MSYLHGSAMQTVLKYSATSLQSTIARKRRKKLTQTLVNNGKPMVIDQTTGEFMGEIPTEELDSSEAIPMNAKFSKAVVAYVHEAFPETPLPLHLAMLEQMGLSDEDNLTLIEAWDSAPGMTLKDFVAEFAGKNIQVLGMQI